MKIKGKKGMNFRNSTEVPFALAHYVVMSIADFWNPTTVTRFHLIS